MEHPARFSSMIRLAWLAALSLLLNGCVALSAPLEGETANHSAHTGTNPSSCAALLATHASDAQWPRSKQFSLAVWNAQKGRNESWRGDLEALTDQFDFVLLQEFANTANWANAPYWSFAPGFRVGSTSTGVATLSRRQPLVRCEFVNHEPWLRSPKATNITQFALQHDTSLVLVNLHAINFSIGLVQFRRQISEAIQAVAAHDGPLIFAGDFNTWRAGRVRVMHEMLSQLGLEPVQFADDQRSRVFGQHLDHLYIRGLDVINATTRAVSTSDHNPMLAILSTSPRAIAPVTPSPGQLLLALDDTPKP